MPPASKSVSFMTVSSNSLWLAKKSVFVFASSFPLNVISTKSFFIFGVAVVLIGALR